MKLTLRTLLAWLDDTLPAPEVREIGKQVHESPMASELVERIHRVTRQRRLTVPHSTGPDGTDPNEVAEYLDNLLPSDAVANFEKTCLKSDVHLAEIASIHQILSLLGQRAKVPPEARQRMYHLIRGREVAGDDEPRAFKPPKAEPVSTAPPWTPATPKRAWLERFGPAAAVLVLVGLLGWSTWASLGLSGSDTQMDTSEIASNVPVRTPPRPVPPIAKAVEPPAQTEAASPPAKDQAKEEGEAAVSEPAEVEVKPSDESTPAVATPAPPAGSLARLADEDGVALHLVNGGSEGQWERARSKTAFKADDLVVGLDPYRNRIEFGPGRVTLVKDTAIRLHTPKSGSTARLDLLQGRVVLQGIVPAQSYAIGLGDQVIEITPPPDGLVGVERVNQMLAGKPEPAPAHLVIRADVGPVELSSTGGSETLNSGESIQVDATGVFKAKASDPAPNWVSETSLSPLDAEAGKQFGRFFQDGKPPLTSLAEATVDDRPEMRRFAIEGLGTIGEVMLVVGALSTQGTDQAGQVRRASIETLREILARGGDPAQRLRAELVDSGGSEEWADEVLKLLAGFTLAEAMEESTQAHLVELLTHPDIGVRELALLNLREISNRGDDLGYDPEQPEGVGLKNWQDLLNRGQLRQAPPKTP